MSIDVATSPHEVMDRMCDLAIVRMGRAHPGLPVEADAIFGSPTLESSFKSILGLGLLLLARERGELAAGQVVVESTSGSLGVGLAAAGRMLGHPVVLISDVNIPSVTRRKLELLGARLILVHEPDPVGGFQQARDERLRSLLSENPGWYWTCQNDSDLNPETYRRFLLPPLAGRLEERRYTAAIFCAGSGGHFSAFSEWLTMRGVPSYVADRQGSVTFGGAPGPSTIRGSGNQNCVPAVMRKAMGRVTGVYEVAERDAYAAVHALARRGLYVGPSSGVCWHGVGKLAEDVETGRILTFFPDRGEIYGPTLLEQIDG